MLTKLIKPILAALLLAGVIVIASDVTPSGGIKGTARDKETGQPVIGASILVKGTKIGSTTDPDGNYQIMRLAPGIYSLVISSVEYTTRETTDVVVTADTIIRVDFNVEKKITELDKTITVTADKDIIDKFEVSNQTTISKRSMKPVQTVDNLLRSATGVQNSSTGQVHIRGGRTGYFPPSNGGSAVVNGVPFDAMFFEHYGVNPFVDVEDDPLSTFAADIDDASYVMVRSYLDRGELPPAAAVRAEEFVNHFKYAYARPLHQAFSINLDGGQTPFAPANVKLLRIGINGFKIPVEQRKPANLVFVIDVSGSMAIETRLELVKKALRTLVEELSTQDQVGIVVFGSEARVVLEPTSIAYRNRIVTAIDGLCTNGSTNTEDGLRLGYAMADRNFEKEKINRIVLCSDGVANVGNTGPDQILREIKEFVNKGITLSTVGFGMNNYNDILMEQLGDKGNGHYSYVDNLQEARRVFTENLSGALQVIARDVKLQVEFNPSTVRSYRLIGYENRDVADQDFRNDTIDGGEIGSGHQVTALYEMKLVNGSLGDLGSVSVRYKDPNSGQIVEVKQEIGGDMVAGTFEDCQLSFRLAACAAQFAEIMRKSYWAKGESIDDLLKETSDLYHESGNESVLELVEMIRKADKFRGELAQR